MAQKMIEITYICYCSKHVKLDQRYFNAHMEACLNYQKKSQFYQLLKEEYIQQASVTQILGMKTGLEILVDQMNLIIGLDVGNSEYFCQNYEEKFLQKEAFCCLCNDTVAPSQKKMKDHIKSCQLFLEYFPFNIAFIEKKADFEYLPSNNLIALKFEFIFLIDKLTQLTIQKSAPKKVQVGVKSGIIGQAKKCDLFCAQAGQVNYEEIITHESCKYNGCRTCFQKSIKQSIEQDIQNIKCPFCSTTVQEIFLKQVLKPEEFDNLLKKQHEALIESQGIVKCVKCDWSGVVEDNIVAENLKYPKTQKKLSNEHIEHYRTNRFVCQCQVEQCKKCRANPYHLGFTCEQFEIHRENNGCRFCGDELGKNDVNFCCKQECFEKAQHACQKKHQCGHFCGGVKNERQCIPCLHSKCYKQEGINGREMCAICLFELNNAPVVYLPSCGHAFHHHCIVNQMKMKWTGKIDFNFCLCSLCKKWMVLNQCPELQKELNNYSKIQKNILERARNRLLNDQEQLKKMPASYKNNIDEYALDTFCYFECSNCNKSYFGGKKDCQMEDQDQDKNKLLCSKCLQVDGCPIHYHEYLEYKCKFCCSIASWFCWQSFIIVRGTTHFCQSCHDRQCNKDYISKYPREQLPFCRGKDFCPLKIDHPPNGDEFFLGCGMCRSNKEGNQKKQIQQF